MAKLKLLSSKPGRIVKGKFVRNPKIGHQDYRVLDSGGNIVATRSTLDAASKLAQRFAQERGKPFQVVWRAIVAGVPSVRGHWFGNAKRNAGKASFRKTKKRMKRSDKGLKLRAKPRSAKFGWYYKAKTKRRAA